MISDMEENQKSNESKNIDHFAKCNLSWFKQNMTMAPTTGQESHLGQCWEVTESDSMGPVVIQVNRLIAGRTEVWYRLGATKGDAVFEKRLEYPIGVDVE